MEKDCTWKHRRRASSPWDLRRLENPQSISLMSTVPSRLLSNRSKILGARGTRDDIFIAFSTSSNSDRVALSPFAHLRFANIYFLSESEKEEGKKKRFRCDGRAHVCLIRKGEETALFLII